MSTSKKNPATIRQGGPGSSQDNAKEPLNVEKPGADDERNRRSNTSTGGGEKDTHHTHSPAQKS